MGKLLAFARQREHVVLVLHAFDLQKVLFAKPIENSPHRGIGKLQRLTQCFQRASSGRVKAPQDKVFHQCVGDI
jgi:hypothetical protein